MQRTCPSPRPPCIIQQLEWACQQLGLQQVHPGLRSPSIMQRLENEAESFQRRALPQACPISEARHASCSSLNVAAPSQTQALQQPCSYPRPPCIIQQLGSGKHHFKHEGSVSIQAVAWAQKHLLCGASYTSICMQKEMDAMTTPTVASIRESISDSKTPQ